MFKFKWQFKNKLKCYNTLISIIVLFVAISACWSVALRFQRKGTQREIWKNKICIITGIIEYGEKHRGEKKYFETPHVIKIWSKRHKIDEWKLIEKHSYWAIITVFIIFIAAMLDHFVDVSVLISEDTMDIGYTHELVHEYLKTTI